MNAKFPHGIALWGAPGIQTWIVGANIALVIGQCTTRLDLTQFPAWKKLGTVTVSHGVKQTAGRFHSRMQS